MQIFQVGSSISMTYISGQPIVFVGTGQTYTDLKSLNAKVRILLLLLCYSLHRCGIFN